MTCWNILLVPEMGNLLSWIRQALLWHSSSSLVRYNPDILSPSIHLSIHPSIQPAIHPSIHTSIDPTVSVYTPDRQPHIQVASLCLVCQVYSWDHLPINKPISSICRCLLQNIFLSQWENLLPKCKDHPNIMICSSGWVQKPFSLGQVWLAWVWGQQHFFGFGCKDLSPRTSQYLLHRCKALNWSMKDVEQFPLNPLYLERQRYCI